jgi:predicted 3-demethylubiquinone-9 3-methyltransferase (glyoxalase superfamily)
MQKITPCLWFNNQAEEAVNFYTSIFKNTKVGSITRYDKASAEVSGQAEGSVLTMEFQLAGYDFLALNGGPLFKFTPAISFMVNCETEEEIDQLWEKLSDGGVILMPYDKYPFSEKYGWISDKYGVSWQLSLSRIPQKITTSFLFVSPNAKGAEEAMNLYISLFDNSNVLHVDKYGEGEERAGSVRFAMFTLDNQEFTAMDGGDEHKFTFSPAISLIVNCENQEEIDKFWNALSSVREAEQCGWLQDKFGVSWQVVPEVLSKLLSSPDKEKAARVMKAMLEMKKLDIEGLENA